MENIEINEENYKLYKTYYRLLKQEENPIPQEPNQIFKAIVLGIFTVGVPIILGMQILSFIASSFLSPIGHLLLTTLVVAIGATAGTLSLFTICEKWAEKATNKFLKEHPEISSDIDLKTLRTKLKTYQVVRDIPSNFQEEQEEHIENLEQQFRKMSVDEKIQSLKEEREFWEIVQKREHYQQLDEEEKALRKTLQ